MLLAPRSLLPAFLLHLVAVNILSLSAASFGFPGSGDSLAPSCTVAPRSCMHLASSSPALTYHVSVGGALRAVCSSSGGAQRGAHSILSSRPDSRTGPSVGLGPLLSVLLLLSPPTGERSALFPKSYQRGEKISRLPYGVA